MFEFRLRVLDVRERETDAASYLGVVEGFLGILVHADCPDVAEADLVRAVCDYLENLRRSDETRIELDEFPTIRVARLRLTT